MFLRTLLACISFNPVISHVCKSEIDYSALSIVIASLPNSYSIEFAEDCIVNLRIIRQMQSFAKNHDIKQITIRARSFVGEPTTIDLSDCEYLSKLDIKFTESTVLTFELPRRAPNLSFSLDQKYRRSPPVRL